MACLAHLAEGKEEAGATARAGLGEALGDLALEGFIDAVEVVVHQVRAEAEYWPEALLSLENMIRRDAESIDCESANRVRRLIVELEPKSLESRIQLLVKEMPWNYPSSEALDHETRSERQVEAVRALADELLREPAILSQALPKLCTGKQRMAYAFGMAVRALADSPLEWLEPITQAVVEAPENERDFDLLAGYVAGLAEGYPDAVAAFKQRAAESPELAPAFLQVCWRLGITASDIQLAIEAFQKRLLLPRQLNLWIGALDKLSASEVAPLFDAMLDHSAEAFTVAVDLMGMYAHRVPEKLEELRPQILKLAENIGRPKRRPSPRMEEFGFKEIMDWMLSKGRPDPDARATALALAKAVANVEELVEGGKESPLKPVLPMLLSSFPEIAWPLIGQAIVSDETKAWRLAFILGDYHGAGRTILSLPEDVLFAWCHAHPDCGPAFAARIVPILSTQQNDTTGRPLHPVMVRLLDEFGERDDVQRAVRSNLFTFSWQGSRTTHFALYKEPLHGLLKHPRPKVRRWAKAMLSQLNAAIEEARIEDEEREARWDI